MATLAAVQSSCAFASPDPLDRAIQRELAALATLEADHRSACRWLDEWSAPEGVKEGLACRLEARHRTEREAHVLHQKRMLLTMSDAVEPTDGVSGGFSAAQGRSKPPRPPRKTAPTHRTSRPQLQG